MAERGQFRGGRGEIVEWNDERGFGFIEDPDIGGRVFFHIKDFGARRRPQAGDEVVYELKDGQGGRPAARLVQLASVERAARRAPMRVTVRIVGAVLLVTAIMGCLVAGRAPWWLPLCYLGVGVASFAAYWLDKRAAEQGEWRTAEMTLHLIDLAGGIVGGLLAQGILRHKSSKLSFGLVSGAIFALHMAALLALTAGLFRLR